MGRIKTFGRRWWVLALLLTFAFARAALAIYLDDEQNVSLRARVYTQGAFRTEGSYDNTTPTVRAGQMVQHRNFFNPELEAKLVSYTSWMKDAGLGFLAPDALDFRLAGWAFYDGVYDYGPNQFHDQWTRTKANNAHFFEVTNINQTLKGTNAQGLSPAFADEDNPRDIFSSQRRINELYLSYSKGPLFLRVGRQAISWGESDTVALLDQNNPFDLTLGAPGIFEDVDEARIPLWTIRSSYNLFDTLGPLSSGFVEAYWVPGDIDTTTSIVPPPTWSPYTAPSPDPQTNPLLATLGNPIFYLADHVPAPKMANSRYGFRTQAVVARDYTVSAWVYTAFNQAPVPRMDSRAQAFTGAPNKILQVELVHKLVPVIGVSNTFFSEPLNGIIRMEAEYFNREPGFIPSANLDIPRINQHPQDVEFACPPINAKTGVGQQCVGQFATVGRVPYADYLRWELGYDRNIFIRPLNPTNSFIWVTAIVGAYNMSETRYHDFYFDGQQKPGTFTHAEPQPADFVQQQKVEAFMQSHLQSDYMHGRLTPAVTVIVNRLGTVAVPFQLTYRYTDSLLFDLFYVNISGAFTQLGFFRDRDQVALRATYQLN